MRALFGALAFCAIVAGCATELPPPIATFDGIQHLRAANISTLALGEFGPAPELSSARDRSVSFRADALHPPGGGTFSGYLKQTVEAELAGAGKLDPASHRMLSAALTRTEVSTMGAQSHASLGARFELRVDGVLTFSKELVVDDAWPSSFMGATAIPEAENHYSELFARLFTALLADPEFVAAAR